ncbi:DUF262 domain-containing protein [Crocosphaera sp.]|uniref:DUF262 domain-containing protein n=1 Tax=Crocosphaera sp. TaxID=2729996 RepID=UPI002602FEF0|nr:DUF262 domain-containing protein [Crocosphaera sp.]MDJ0580407.1 DUF262 domain-containing protein [Crocosphaera sp.]
MKASETSIRNLLEGTKQFQVPLFQRPYSWKKNNWDTLWYDLMSIYDGDVDGSYFLGPIVTQSISSTADGISLFLIIDGQQRLTTLSILLASLRDKLREENPRFSEQLHEYFLINKFQDNDDYFKVLPTQADRNSYKAIIDLEINPDEANGKITESYQYFTKKINKEKADFCEKIKNIILEKLVIVNITSGEDDNPYLIFESLNNKGEELTQADLVRNYIFMKLPRESREKQYNRLWLPLENRFKEQAGEKYSGELTNAFWFYLRKDGRSVSKNNIYQSLKKKIDNSSDGLQEELQSLVKFSQYYECLNFPETEESDSMLKKYFIGLKKLDFTTSHIFLLNVYHNYQNSEISKDDFEKILIYLESYFVRRLFSGVSTRVLGGIFNNLYKDIQKENTGNIVQRLYKILNCFENQKRWPTDAEFRKGIVIHSIYSQKTAERTKFIIEKLEKSQGRETVDISELSVEHIMPQTLSNKWKQTLGGTNARNYKSWLHTLGNLTLTAYNSELSNKPYSDKQEYLIDSNLYLNRYFRDINDWNFDEIKERGNRLADIAIRVWPR